MSTYVKSKSTKLVKATDFDGKLSVVNRTRKNLYVVFRRNNKGEIELEIGLKPF